MSSKNFGETAYKRRLVLFLDILGFSNAVSEDEIAPEAILGTLHHLKRLEREANETVDAEAVERETGLPPNYVVHPRATFFSDCIVISVPATNIDALWLFEAAATIQNMLVGAGFLSRGAICVGPVYHDQDFVFGPTFVRAVKLEKATCQPRVAVESEVVEIFRATATEQDRQVIRIREGQLLQHCDETSYIDPFHMLKLHAHSADPPIRYMEVIQAFHRWKQVIQIGLLHVNDRTRAKYEWAAGQFNERMAPPGGWLSPIQIFDRAARDQIRPHLS